MRVIRGAEPNWFNAAVSMNRGPERNTTWALSKHQIENLGIHASETAWVGTKFDYVIDNNGTMDDLFGQVKDLVQGLQRPMDVQVASLLQSN